MAIWLRSFLVSKSTWLARQWKDAAIRGFAEKSEIFFRITERGSPVIEWPGGERHSALTCFSICTELHEVRRE